MADNRSVPELLGDLMNQMSSLFRKEVQLARAEMGESVSHASSSAATIAIGGALLLGALIVLLEAAVAGLVELGLDVWLSCLIVGIVVALIGYALVRSGMSSLRASSLAPHRTVEQLSRDAAAAKEQVR